MDDSALDILSREWRFSLDRGKGKGGGRGIVRIVLRKFIGVRFFLFERRAFTRVEGEEKIMDGWIMNERWWFNNSGFTNVILNDFKWWLRFDIVNAFCIICSAVLWEYYEEFYFLYLYNVY